MGWERFGEGDANQSIDKVLNMKQERRATLLAVIEQEAFKRLCEYANIPARLRQWSYSAPELQLCWNTEALQSHCSRRTPITLRYLAY